MHKNNILLTLIAFMTYMVMSGLLTQIGVILNDLAAQMGLPPAQAVSVFSWLTGGALTGTFSSLFIYSHFAVPRVMQLTYGLFLLVLMWLLALTELSSSSLMAGLFLLGLCCGIGLAGGAVIISNIYQENQRAAAFLSTDCAFSAAGFIFPSLAIVLLGAGIHWQWSYAAVGVVALLIFVCLLLVSFEPVAVSSKMAGSSASPLKQIMTLPVILMGIGVCGHLIAQTTFLTWAPNYLQQSFGLTAQQAGAVVGNYWGLSIFGLISAALLVNKIPARTMLMVVAVIAIGITGFFNLTRDANSFLLMSFAFGFLTTCIYKIAMAVGSMQVAQAPPVLITFLLFSGNIGSTCAPALSGWVVAHWGVAASMQMSWLAYVMVGVMFAVVLGMEQRRNVRVNAGLLLSTAPNNEAN